MPHLPETAQIDQASVCLGALGVRVVVDTRGNRAAELAEALRLAWAWCPSDTLTGEPLHIEAMLDDDPRIVAAAQEAGRLADTDARAVLGWLSSAVTTAAITARAGQLVMLHGCAVADPGGGATVVLVGPSGAGKTTAATTLGRRWAYVTDETVALRADGSVLPYPKPLSVLRGPAHLGKDQLAPAELGLVRPGDGLRLASILLLERTDGGPDHAAVEPVPTVQALALLGEQSSFLAELDRPLQQLAALVGSTGGVARVRYREAASLVDVVAGLLGERP